MLLMLSRLTSFRRMAAVGVAAAGLEGLFSAATPNLAGRDRLLKHLAPAALPSAAHLLALVAGLALLLLAPRLWRGTKTAASLAVVWLALLALLNIVKGLDYEETLLDVGLLLLVAIGRGAFPLGCRSRPRLAVVCAALGAWALTWCAELFAPLVTDRGETIKLAYRHTLGHVFAGSLVHPRIDEGWITFVELLAGCAVAASLVVVRSWTAPAREPWEDGEKEHRAARALVWRHGEDSISPFMLRPDKSFHFAAEGVLAYALIGGTAVVSGDPVAPDGRAPEVLASFLSLARRSGWRVVVWGSSDRYLGAYRELGLHVMRVGEEAFVDPAHFTLEGRRVRKLRQSVNRVARHGWKVQAHIGRDLDDTVEREIDGFEARWRAGQERIHGFAMGMGAFDTERWPDDLYLLARSPGGELRAVMRFIEHCGRLSLDTMHRVGETPNGLNEALICRALEIARERGIPEVSLNYAGLGHLVRTGGAGRGAVRLLARVLSAGLGSRFQMAGLVQFDDKFNPEWRPRHLVYQSAAALPVVGLRVLQAEGYLPRRSPRAPNWGPGLSRRPPESAPVEGAVDG
jgi:lysyl-tRNA synthetase class 2